MLNNFVQRVNYLNEKNFIKPRGIHTTIRGFTMSFTMSEIAAIQNYTKNGQAGSSVDLMEKEAIEYAKENNCTKEEAMNVLYEQYNKATGSVFTDDVMANAKDDRGAFVDGLLEGLDIFDMFDTTSKQQALNDLADIEPSFAEKAGKFVGASITGAALGVAAGAIIGGIVAGPAGAIFGATIGPKVTNFLKKTLLGAGLIGGVIAANKAVEEEKEETYAPKTETTAYNDKDTTLAQEPEEIKEELEEEKEENV